MPKKIGPRAQILEARAENSCRVNGPYFKHMFASYHGILQSLLM